MAKKQEIRSMFDLIAWRYDFLNHFLSFGTDFFWRRKAINEIGKRIDPATILDVATGTCDLAITALRLSPESVCAVDFSQRMLEEGRKKIHRKKLEKKIDLVIADSEDLPFDDSTFDVAMVAFGVRNFENPGKGLGEMYRVIKPGGVVMVLEFSRPSNFPFRYVYNFYFHRILPVLGNLFSEGRNAYRYLPESVSKFPEGDDFIDLMREIGFTDLSKRSLTGGVATIYTGNKQAYNNHLLY
ncbi:MAG TPA: bifunctional demethylmenaquinone methyltransferase/2-methoxy-6-polyprenyl-1,4-benzoquinol methylase UbiE [Bacteroidales bacterium]|nr:bifunctional demethylmenaquinone methyltransferase/2-methoxy-6-polyprenyl-1,4-benzoquinol methylase UbiE [Bacteroidales bacterium]